MNSLNFGSGSNDWKWNRLRAHLCTRSRTIKLLKLSTLCSISSLVEMKCTFGLCRSLLCTRWILQVVPMTGNETVYGPINVLDRVQSFYKNCLRCMFQLFVCCSFCSFQVLCLVQFGVCLHCVSLHPRIPNLTGWACTQSVTKDSTLANSMTSALCSIWVCLSVFFEKSINFSPICNTPNCK